MTVYPTASHDGGENQANIRVWPGGGGEACADARSRNQTGTTHLQHQTALATNNLTRHFQHDSQVDKSPMQCVVLQTSILFKVQ